MFNLVIFIENIVFRKYHRELSSWVNNIEIVKRKKSIIVTTVQHFLRNALGVCDLDLFSPLFCCITDRSNTLVSSTHFLYIDTDYFLLSN